MNLKIPLFVRDFSTIIASFFIGSGAGSYRQCTGASGLGKKSAHPPLRAAHGTAGKASAYAYGFG
ncbi:hypothetical protein [Paenibacillus naphthalenovorans]|uniref:hypothetical protein n=1 Tax=Paenibacillus naphthalenovorans TaxID=162209 RepID=UPI0010F57A13|nr:hypothetical protein [Paenibacillus naphthalenovorans]